jgi:integrase
LRKPEDKHRLATVRHNYQRNSSLPEWHGCHAFRRGAATNLHRLGVDDYTIAQILSHEDVAVTRDCYIKDDNKEALSAMNRQWPPIGHQKRRFSPSKA